MKYKLFISDYDGTLAVAGTSHIDEDVVSAIKEYEKKGGIFVICSGRPFKSLKKIADKYQLKGVAVSIQGARANELDTGKVIMSKGIEPSVGAEIIKGLQNEVGEPVVYIGEEFYFQNHSHFAESYEKILQTPGVKVDNLVEFVNNSKEPIAKICLISDREDVSDIVNRLNEEHKDKKVAVNSGAKYLVEVIDPRYGKGSAVEFLAKYFGVDLKEVIAVGDSTNDVLLLDGAWHGVAVGDAVDVLKAVADEVTVPLEEKPIKYLLEKYCL